MKNFQYQEKVIAGQPVKTLRSLSGETIDCVDDFIKVLFANNAPVGTVETYVPCVCKYLDFTVEAMSLLSGNRDDVANVCIVDLYFQALSLACESEEVVVRAVVARLGWSVASTGTVKVNRAALDLFFQCSERYKVTADSNVQKDSSGSLEAEELNVIESNLPEPIEFDYRKKGWHARKVKSYLAECIAGGVGVKALNTLPQYFLGGSARNMDELRLRFSDVKVLIESAGNLRDKVYYALLGAGGARVSETLQVLLSDINFKKRTVRIVDPKSRKSLYRSMGLKSSQINSLRFKGRSNQQLTLIEPFATMFWEGLEELLRSPLFPAVDANGMYIQHDFIFCVSRGRTKGVPLCLVDQSPVLRTFKANLKKVGLPVARQHDVRHMYVSYMCNEIPTDDGRGFGVEKTSSIVGHINIESTERYNHFDAGGILDAAENFYIEHGFYNGELDVVK